MLVFLLVTIATGIAEITIKLLVQTVTVITTAISSILFEIWIVLARFRKKLFNLMLKPWALFLVVR